MPTCAFERLWPFYEFAFDQEMNLYAFILHCCGEKSVRNLEELTNVKFRAMFGKCASEAIALLTMVVVNMLQRN